MENPVVKVTQGQLRGTVGTNIRDEKIYAFKGIPYAKPPVGDLRFKAPLPAEPWTGIRDAIKDGKPCYQKNALNLGGPQYMGSEDCLFLNVYTKTLPEEDKKLKPVMVFIHGGAFIMGSGDEFLYGPGILMTEDIVLVTINYRLGVFGFLSLKDISLNIPGNAGLKDQTLALKWVQQNIQFFNGDPNNVTIFGESAGGASVHYQILSSAAKGLFHKAIVQSGTTLNPWPQSAPNINSFVKYLGQEPKTDKELLDLLMKTSKEDILQAQGKFSAEMEGAIRILGPVIEQPNSTEFITKDPIDIINSKEYNKIPMIFGYNSNEGLVAEFDNMTKRMEGLSVSESIKPLEYYIPWQMELEKGGTSWNTIVDKMKQVYQTGENKDNKYLVATDSLFTAGTIAAVHNHIKNQSEPIYLYRVSIITGRNMLSRNLQLDHKLGVCHADELGYLFTSAMVPNEIEKGSAEEIGIKYFLKLWTNFAKYGNPTPNERELGIIWKAVEKNNRYFLDIDKELTLKINPEPERMELWKEIYLQSHKTAAYMS